MRQLWFRIRSRSGRNLRYCPDGSAHDWLLYASVRHGYRAVCADCLREVCKQSTAWDEFEDWYEKGEGFYEAYQARCSKPTVQPKPKLRLVK